MQTSNCVLIIVEFPRYFSIFMLSLISIVQFLLPQMSYYFLPHVVSSTDFASYFNENTEQSEMHCHSLTDLPKIRSAQYLCKCLCLPLALLLVLEPVNSPHPRPGTEPHFLGLHKQFIQQWSLSPCITNLPLIGLSCQNENMLGNCPLKQIKSWCNAHIPSAVSPFICS